MANTIVFGVGSEGNYSSSTTTVGWNIGQKAIWGNTADDTFSFSDAAYANEFFQNAAYNIYGGGGADTVSFADYTDGAANDISFNLSQLVSKNSSNKFTVVGSVSNDTFLWAGGASPYFTLFDGNGGNDTFSIENATAGKTINLYDAAYQNIDILIGSSLGDTLRGTTANETISGGKGADQLWGGDGAYADSLAGGVGADTFWFGANQGADKIAYDGETDSKSDVIKFSGINFANLKFASGAGNDTTISFKDSTGYAGSLTIEQFLTFSNDASKRINTFVTDDLTFGLALGNDGASWSLGGSSLVDYIAGFAGKDTLVGGAGDTLNGGGNDDLLKYVSTVNLFDGGANDTVGDALSANWSSTAVEINLYDSKIKNIEVLVGSSLNDILRGNSVAETLFGGEGADNLWGGDGVVNDVMAGGAGADTFWFYKNQGEDVIDAEATTAYSASDVVRLSGINFADLSFAASANDAKLSFTDASGYTGNLLIENFVGYSNDTTKRLNTFVADDMTFGLAIANDGYAVGSGWTLRGSSLADYIVGATGKDTLTAGAGDSLYGAGNDDQLNYFATASFYDGGANDTAGDALNANQSTTAIDLNLYDANVKNIEILYGSSLSDVLRGSTLANTLVGGLGADHLWGNQGDDSLAGGAGADTYWFGLLDGVDTIANETTNNASDVVKFKDLNFSSLSFGLDVAENDLEITVGGDSTNKLVLSGWTTVAGNNTNTSRLNTFIADDLTFGLAIAKASTSTTLKGTALADYMQGSSAADSIGGSAGADTIFAKAGDDNIVYKATAATVDGGDDNDYLSAAAYTAGVDIDLRNVDATKTNFANIEHVTGSSYDDILRGTTGAQTLVGGAGNDALWGAAGADSIEGGAGTDSYWFGGADGNDTVVYSTMNSSDYVVFSSIDGKQIGGADLKTVETSGDDLVITLSTDDTLTLAGWNSGTSGTKLNKFNFGANGNYSLAFTDGVATWTKIS